MEFVFSAWYFVIIALVIGIVVCVFLFVKMDKKDRVLIDQFIKETQSANEVETNNNSTDKNNENKTE